MNPNDFKEAYGVVNLFENQNTGEKYNYFLPKPLPPEVRFDMKLTFACSKASTMLGKLSGACLQLPNPDLLVMPYLKKEALMSSRIEGTRISLSDLLISEIENKDDNYKSTVEVINYVDAVNFGLEKLKEVPINGDLIKEMHRILMREVRGGDLSPGQYRTVQNWIGPEKISRIDSPFVPPIPEQVSGLMEDLFKFLNLNDDIPPLIKCALIHYQFESIHPFCDGNGRIGRSIITLYLCQNKLMIKPLLYISGFFESHKTEYTDLLFKTNQSGKFEDWILFFLNAVYTQAEDALNRAIKLQDLRENYRKKAQELSKTTSIPKIIDQLFYNPFIKTNTIEKKLGITYKSARSIIDKLVQLNILKPRTEGRNITYVAYEILDTINI